MTFIKCSPLLLVLAVTAFAKADETGTQSGQTLNLYGTSKNLSKVLSSMEEAQHSEIGGVREWRLFSGRKLNKAELKKFCPSCTEVDPIPAPIPVIPCNKASSTANSQVLAYRIKGTPGALAQLADIAGRDKEIKIRGKYVVQMVNVADQSAQEKVKKLCKNCIELDPLPIPIPVGGGPCK